MPTSADFLLQVPFFADLDRDARERVAARLEERGYERGEIICHEHDPAVAFWIVRSGSVNVVKIGREGRTTILETVNPGDSFGMVAVLDGGGVPATVEARKATTLVVVRAIVFDAILEVEPRVAKAVARYLARRLRRTTCRSASVCLLSVRSRVAAHLLEKAQAPRTGEGPFEVELEGTQEEIAHRLGTEREVFARALQSLRKDNLIAQQRGHIELLDVTKLTQLAGT